MMSTNGAKQEARLTDYLDGALDASAAAAFEKVLADDPELRKALEEARRARDLLSNLPRKAAPRDFLRKVQRKVRRRSGGRFFHPATINFSYRISVEVFVVIAVAVMAACWFFAEAARPIAPGPLTEVPAATSPSAPESGVRP